MSDSQASSATVKAEQHARHATVENEGMLKGLPLFFVLDSHLSSTAILQAEDELCRLGALLTYDITEASIVLANIAQARRARLELRWRHGRTEDIRDDNIASATGNGLKSRSDEPGRKRRKLDKEPESRAREVKPESTTDSETATSTTGDDDEEPNVATMSQLSISHTEAPPTASSSDLDDEMKSVHPLFDLKSFVGKVKVVKLNWLNDTMAKSAPQPFEPYTIYEAKVLPPQPTASNLGEIVKVSTVGKGHAAAVDTAHAQDDILVDIVDHAKAEAKPHFPRARRRDKVNNAMKQDFAGRSFLHAGGSQSRSFTRPSRLLHQTTSEHDEGISHPLPPMPDWVLQNKIYACERATPLRSPNDSFIEQLKKIKLARLLTGDEIGVRAYSTSIASIAAYPHALSSTNEILALPGCDQKVAHLFHEWQTSGGKIRAVIDIEADKVLTVLRHFYDIWGVGAITARQWYYDQQWRDLDDIIEQGWKSLSRVQQIGIKYYDEFLLKMPRSEVEAIAAIVTEHGRRVTDSSLECIIVGGYRRGKDECGDVDLILSHRNENQTYNLVDRVTTSLEDAGWITHTLIMNTTNTKRDQQPVPIAPLVGGHGFDTLDKSLVVWQSQDWPTRSADMAANPKAKNPNVHRRVDIIISPWRTVGCAVAGWTSGTTFQRDLRRYVKKVKGWKFDSSGVRERGTGRFVDLEQWADPKTRAKTWQVAERRVFEGMGLVYREPWDRCTG